ncbi:hypothetical protein LCGC14_1316470 [marine sediment metagenome]|uniref:Uncharacterized protein n=1 Tax=marine sediment metagenome TaxID=412755 RepID=A0A0F9KKR9_9ZZZZ
MARNSVLAKENRIMINSVKDDITEIKDKLTKLSNHYSKRLPVWATAIISLLSALSVGLIVAMVK